jgi:hypothetical protein
MAFAGSAWRGAPGSLSPPGRSAPGAVATFVDLRFSDLALASRLQARHSYATRTVEPRPLRP